MVTEPGESKCFTNLGNAYQSLGDFRKAIEYYEKSLEIKKEIGDRFGESACYGNLGNAYQSLGDFRVSVRHIYFSKIDLFVRRKLLINTFFRPLHG